MREYLDLLRDVLENGKPEPTGAVLQSTGEKVMARSVFGRQVTIPLDRGFPLLSTKRVWFKGVLHELLWMIGGGTNIRPLQEAGVHIWDQWANSAGEIGPAYGYQWRAFPSLDWTTGKTARCDQLAKALEDIRAVAADPWDRRRRRILVSAWNPVQVPDMGLPPCHTLYQFGVSGGRISTHVFCRSIDTFLGLPFNIAQYALLTHILAKLAGLQVGTLVMSFSDLHLYENHVEPATVQLGRQPDPKLPTLVIHGDPRSLDDLRPEQFLVVGYSPQPALPGEVAV